MAKYEFPTQDDELDDIINTIFRLEDTYMIEPIEMANGNLSQQFPSPFLNGTVYLFIFFNIIYV
jgi:hypothetical protein